MTIPKKLGGLGIRDSRQTNMALLGKVVWNILNQPTRLSSKVLIQKYLGCESIFLTSPNRKCSYVWQGILKTIDRLRDGFKFRIGTGDISIWYNHWIGNSKLCHELDYVHISDSDLRVHDLWDDGKWNLQRLATILPQHLTRSLTLPSPHSVDAVIAGFR